MLMNFELEMPYYDAKEISDLELALVWQYVDKLNSKKSLESGEELYNFHCSNRHGLDARRFDSG